MYNDVIDLISETEAESENGDLIPSETKKTVLANVRSIGMKEKYEALSNGLHPECTFVIADYLDYNNEQYVEFGSDSTGNPVRYRVLRTFRRDGADELEIVVTR